MSRWVYAHRRADARMRSLVGRIVTGWHGVEIALDEDPIRWSDPRCPFLQVDPLVLTFDDGESLEIEAGQDDAYYELTVSPPVPRPPGFGEPEDHSIFRARTFDLPCGRIHSATFRRTRELEDLSVTQDPHPLLVLELELRVGDRDLLLVAAQVYFDAAGDFVLARGDESVLVFTDPAAAEGMPWRPPRSADG